MSKDLEEAKEAIAREQGYESFSAASKPAQNTMEAAAKSRLDDDFSMRIAFRPTHWDDEGDE